MPHRSASLTQAQAWHDPQRQFPLLLLHVHLLCCMRCRCHGCHHSCWLQLTLCHPPGQGLQRRCRCPLCPSSFCLWASQQPPLPAQRHLLNQQRSPPALRKPHCPLLHLQGCPHPPGPKLQMHLPHQLICYPWPSSSCCSSYLPGLRQARQLFQPQIQLPAQSQCIIV